MFKKRFINQLINSFFDLSPILAVVVIFQVLIIRQSIPDVGHFVVGIVFVLVGLSLFIQGLELSLFPLGESMAYALQEKVVCSGYLLLPSVWDSGLLLQNLH